MIIFFMLLKIIIPFKERKATRINELLLEKEIMYESIGINKIS